MVVIDFLNDFKAKHFATTYWWDIKQRGLQHDLILNPGIDYSMSTGGSVDCAHRHATIESTWSQSECFGLSNIIEILHGYPLNSGKCFTQNKNEA